MVILTERQTKALEQPFVEAVEGAERIRTAASGTPNSKESEPHCIGPCSVAAEPVPLIPVWVDYFQQTFYVCESCLASVKTPMVYFIRGGNLVKIGFARDVPQRIRSHQIGSPVPLELWHMIPGERDLERQLHERFAADRSHGEWFRISDELRAFVEGAAA